MKEALMPSAQSPTIVFNGKFLCASMTGVHRVAHELISSFCEAGKAGCNANVGIAVPPNTGFLSADYHAKIISRGIFRGRFWHQIWEQLELPWQTRGQILISLCNLAPVLKTSAVTMIHDAQVFSAPLSYTPGFRLWYRIVLRLVGGRHRTILTVSNYSKGELVRFGLAPAKRIVVVYNGVDHMLNVDTDERIIDRHSLMPQQYVVAIASTQRHKNIAFLLSVFRSQKLADKTLLLVGDADEKAFKERVGALPANVRLAGRLSDGELRAILENALCTACPSLTEGFGLLPLEGMILGCPAIVSPRGAHPEVCGDAAVYAEPDDEAAWISAINCLASSQGGRSKIVDAGRQRAAQFTWAKAAAQLQAIIDDIIDSDRTRLVHR